MKYPFGVKHFFADNISNIRVFIGRNWFELSFHGIQGVQAKLCFFQEFLEFCDSSSTSTSVQFLQRNVGDEGRVPDDWETRNSF